MKINNIGYSSIIFFITETMFLHIGLTEILNSAETNSIYSVLLGGLISILVLYFIIKLFNYKKDLNIFVKIEIIFGKLIGNIINLFLVLLIILYFTYSLWSINTYVQNKYLDSTPSFIIILLFLIPVVLSQVKGIKTISKASLILLLITTLIIAFSIFNLYSSIDIDNFKPFFYKSFFIVLKNAFIFSSYFVTPVFMILVTPKDNIYNNINLTRKITFFFIISIINLLLLFIFIIGIFGIDLAKILSYPEYSLMKKINFFDFIQHIENISTIEWLFSIFITSSFSLNFIKEYLNYKKINNIIYFFIIIVCFLLALVLFNNTTIANNMIKKYFILIYYIPILIILISSNILKRNKS